MCVLNSAVGDSGELSTEVTTSVTRVVYLVSTGCAELCSEWSDFVDFGCVVSAYDSSVGLLSLVGWVVSDVTTVDFYACVVLVAMWSGVGEDTVELTSSNVPDWTEVYCVVCDETVCVEVETEGSVDEGSIRWAM